LESNSLKTYDDRYIETGLSISEYDIQESSGVLATLRAQPLYEQYVPSDLGSKEATTL